MMMMLRTTMGVYQWVVFDDTGHEWTAATWNTKIGNTIGRHPNIERLIFFAEQSNLPQIEFVSLPGMQLIFCQRWHKVLVDGVPKLMEYQVIGYKHNGVVLEAQIDLVSGALRLVGYREEDNG